MKGKMKTKQISALLEMQISMCQMTGIKQFNKNLEHFIIPQPSLLHKVMHRSTQRPAASSRENHCSYCGQPGHRRSHGSPITCPALLQSHQQASKHHRQKLHPLTLLNHQLMPHPQPPYFEVPPSEAHIVTLWEVPLSKQ